MLNVLEIYKRKYVEMFQSSVKLWEPILCNNNKKDFWLLELQRKVGKRVTAIEKKGWPDKTMWRP